MRSGVFVNFSAEDAERYQLLFSGRSRIRASPESYALAVEVFEQMRPVRRRRAPRPGPLRHVDGSSRRIERKQITNDPGGQRWLRLIDEMVECTRTTCLGTHTPGGTMIVKLDVTDVATIPRIDHAEQWSWPRWNSHERSICFERSTPTCGTRRWCDLWDVRALVAHCSAWLKPRHRCASFVARRACREPTQRRSDDRCHDRDPVASGLSCRPIS